MLLKLVLCVFLDVEHVVLSLVHGLAPTVDETTASERVRVATGAVDLGRRVEAVVVV